MLGEITLYTGEAPPVGYAFCDGQTVSRSTYPDLFTLIGTTFGDGDGDTTFNLPDLRGRVPVGVGEGAGLSDYVLGDVGGRESVELTTAELPSHTHEARCLDGDAQFTVGGDHVLGNSSDNIYAGGPADSAMHASAISSTGEGEAHENRQPYLALNYIIQLEA